MINSLKHFSRNMGCNKEPLNKGMLHGLPWKCLEDVLELSQNPQYQDVTIICDGGKFHVNSFLLASIFPIIKGLLDPSTDEMCISLPDINYQELTEFFSKIYDQSYEILTSKLIFDLHSKSPILKHELLSDIEDEDEIIKYENHVSHHSVDEVKPVISLENILTLKSADNNRIKVDNSEIEVKDHDGDGVEEVMEPLVNENFHVRTKKERKQKVWKKNPKIRTDENTNTHYCTLCSFSNTRRSHVLRHYDGVHAKTKTTYSFAKVVVDDEIKSDSTYSKPKKKYQCSGCEYQSNKIFNIKKHYEAKHVRTLENGYHHCPECKIKLAQDEIDNHSCVFYSCDVCGKQFSSISTVQAHKKSIHEEKGIHSCEMCGKTFDRSSLLNTHIRNHHTEKVSCHICGTKINPHYLRIHLLTHEDKVICKICNKEVKQLRHHMMTVHKSDEQKAQQCPDCGKGFIDINRLKKHQMSVHLKLRPYKCRYGCTFAYNDSSNRNAHERKTHGKIFESSTAQKPI